MNKSVTDQQHYRIFLGELQQHYRDGDVTAKGALKFFFRLKLAEGWKCRIDPRKLREFFSRWDDSKNELKIMARSTFWKAINDLRDEGEIDFSEPSSVVIRLPRSPITDELAGSEAPEEGKRASVQNFEHRPEFWIASKILDEPVVDLNQDKASSSSTDSSQIFSKLSIDPEAETQTENLTGRERPISPDGQIADLTGRGNQLDETPPPTRTIKYDPRLGIKPPSGINCSAPPRSLARQSEKPWIDPNTGGFDKQFVQHTVRLWKQSKGASFADMTDEDVAALVVIHFHKNPESLRLKYQAFAEGAHRHAKSAHMRLEAGISISEKEQRELVATAPAIAHAASLAPEEKLLPSPVPTPAPLPFTPAQSLPSVTPAPSLPPVPLTRTPAPALPQALAPVSSQAVPAPQEFTSEQIAANLARIEEMSKQLGEAKSMNFKRK